MKKIETTVIKEKTVEFVKDHKDVIGTALVAFAGGLVCFKLGEINERNKPDYDKEVYRAFANDCMKALPSNTGLFKIHSFANSTIGKFNGLDAAKSVLEDPETRDSIVGAAIFISGNDE